MTRHGHWSALVGKAREKPYIALYGLVGILYSILLYPMYCLLLKRIGFLSFIHPLASLSNYNHVSIGKQSTINRGVVIWAESIEIGDYVQINPGTCIYGDVRIEDFVMIGPNCTLAGGTHNFDRTDLPMRAQGGSPMEITIEDDVWIGANCAILGGVRIGRGAIIGAGSVVKKDIPAFAIAFGNPAHVKRFRHANVG